MLRLNYCGTLASMHLTILLKLKELDKKNYEAYFRYKCLEYISILQNLIPLAASYRIEQLFGKMYNNIVGGIIEYEQTNSTVFIAFDDNFVNKRVEMLQLTLQPDSYYTVPINANFYISKYLIDCWQNGDKLQKAT